MPMETLTLLQFAGILAAYLCMTLFLPALLFHQKFKKKPFGMRFTVYQMTGNFFMMNLVLVLGLLHISYRITLVLATVAFYAVVFIKIHNRKPKKDFQRLFELAERLAGGQMGVRLFLRRLRDAAWHGAKRGFRFLWHIFRDDSLDILLLAGITAMLWYAYGVNLIRHFGYAASDIPVHNYWINYLARNKIFVAGVYPFGMHCVVYYLRTVFGIPTYVLLRIFWFVQTMMIHYLLLTFIKLCCKSRYLPYIGVFVYMTAKFFGPYAYTRYFSTLPQEFSMLFIYPSLYFLFLFLDRKEEDEISERWYLGLFAISFSMTIAVHFYGTMAAGLLCIGVAIGYFFRIFRKKYFVKIMVSGILSVFIAVLPMVIAFATGTPLQGSLGWGMNIISGSNHSGEETELDDTETEVMDEEEFLEDDESGSDFEEDTDQDVGGEDAEQPVEQSVEKKSALTERLLSYGMRFKDVLWNTISDFYMPQDEEDPPGIYDIFKLALIGSIGVLFVLALLFFLVRQTDYGAKLLTISAGMGIMLVLLCATPLGLPALMDTTRATIFNAYLLPVAWTLCVDGILVLAFGWWKHKIFLHLASLVSAAAIAVAMYRADLIKPMPDVASLQTNEAIVCLTNILRNNEDNTWTIVSMNDEMRMGEDYGRHYEVNDFLRFMENAGPYGEVIIPTQKIFVFIEKVPLDYMGPYEGSGQTISRWGARHALPYTVGIEMYKGEARWIEMSRMYYWAQKFKEAYPNETHVYYETDNFVCYYIEQDPYSLFNFSLDYGYNMRDVQVSDYEESIK